MRRPKAHESLATTMLVLVLSGSAIGASRTAARVRPVEGYRSGGTSIAFSALEPMERDGGNGFAGRSACAQGEVHPRLESSRRIYGAGDDDLRSLLTLPSVADPNHITLRPLDFSPAESGPLHHGFDGPVIDDRPSRWTVAGFGSADPTSPRTPRFHRVAADGFGRVDNPHLWAGLGTLLGGAANMYASGYRLSEFRLRFNPLESERIAVRQQGADMVQHLALGYGLTQYFLDNGSHPVEAAASAFTYEFIAGELFECFPQAGGISVRDLAADLVAVTVAALDGEGDSPVRLWAASRPDIYPSRPSEFDPYWVEVGVTVGRIAGLDVVCTVRNWKDRVPGSSRDVDDDRSPVIYYLANR